MKVKNVSIISYLTPIGWVIGYTQYKKLEKPQFMQYHLRQSLGLIECGILYQLMVSLILLFSDKMGFFLLWGNLLYFIFMGLGMINALNNTSRPIPMIGQFFENKFSFIR